MPPAPEAAYGPVGGSPGGAPPTVRDKWRRLHRNCKVISCYGFLFHFGWSTWERNVFPVFLAKSQGAASVGFVQSLQGVVAVVAAPAFGTWMDRTPSIRNPRRFTVAVGGFALAAVLAATARAEAWPLYGAMALWGVLLSAQGVFTDSVLASSSSRGADRQFAFVAKSTLWRLGNVAGQSLNLLYFAVGGDDWALDGLRRLMAVGVALCFSVGLLALVRDPEAREEPPSEVTVSPLVSDDPGAAPRSEVTASPLVSDDPGAAPPSEAWSPPARFARPAPPPPPWYRRPQMVILVAVLFRVVGKGATMRYIPVLFAEGYAMRPTTLTAVVLVAQAISVFSPLACDALANRFGRAPTMVAVRVVEPAALAALALCANEAAASAAFVAYLGIPVGTRAVEKAVLMDYTAKKSRARWNALEAVNRGTWAGSAAIGAYLVQAHGYPAAFLASAAFCSVSILVLSALLALIRDDDDAPRDGGEVG